MATLYAPLADLRAVLSGTDAGVGTAAQLSDTQLTLALTNASNRLSVYAGNVYDSSTPQATPPDIFHDLTLDIAAYIATTYYMKHKAISTTSPVFIRYAEAMKMLNDFRSGKLRLDVVAPGGVGGETGVVINRIPSIFTGDDSNTAVNPMTGSLMADTPSDMFRPGWQDLDMGSEYQG